MSRAPGKVRLGFLGPAIVIAGLAVGALGIWIMIKNRPNAGPVIDTFDIDRGQKIVVRAEEGGERNFVELHQGEKLLWQAMVPTYAGSKERRAIAVGEISVSIRVVRDGKAEIFALVRENGTKLGGVHLAIEHNAITRAGTGPITLSDGKRSYEIVAGDGWNQLVAVDLRMGSPLWKLELGPGEVTEGVVEGGRLRLVQNKQSRWFHVFTGQEDLSFETTGRRSGIDAVFTQ